MSGWVGGALAVLRVAALAYVGWVVLLFALQRSVLFPGTRRASPRPSPELVPTGISQLWLPTGSGRVEAWLLEAPGEGPRPAIVYAHGNGELIDDWAGPMEPLRAAGIHVLLVEFPGYGHSDGRPSRATLSAAFEAAYDRLAADARVDPARIVAMGRSLGAGVATDLALSRPVAGLVLLSTFTSAGDMAWQGFKVPPFAVRDRFDNRRALAGFDGPVLLLHGRNDDVIPYAHAERLAETREGLEPVPLACAHNDCLAVWPEVLERVRAFVGELPGLSR